MHNKSSELNPGQSLDMVLMETMGPMDLYMRVVAWEKDFQRFSDQMVQHYNAVPEIPYR
jgi:hypothetical protein